APTIRPARRRRTSEAPASRLRRAAVSEAYAGSTGSARHATSRTGRVPRPPPTARASTATRTAWPGPVITTRASAARARWSACATRVAPGHASTRASASAIAPGSTCGYPCPARAMSACRPPHRRTPGARVELAVHVVDHARRQVRVDLGRRDVDVAEHGLHRAQVRAALEQMAREGVAQVVRRHHRPNPGPARGAPDQPPERLARQAVARSVEEERRALAPHPLRARGSQVAAHPGEPLRARGHEPLAGGP